MNKKCLCDNPTCAKCLGGNCQDDNCSIHSIELKIKARERILSNFSVAKEKVKEIRKEILRLEKIWKK